MMMIRKMIKVVKLGMKKDIKLDMFLAVTWVA